MVRLASLLLHQMMDEQPKERGETARGRGEKHYRHYLEVPSLSLKQEKYLAPQLKTARRLNKRVLN